MKIKTYFAHTMMAAIAALSALAFAACSDDDDTAASYDGPEIESPLADFSPQGGTGTIILKAEADNVTSSAEWCEVSPAGRELTVRVAPLTQLEARNAVVAVSRNGRTIHIPVHQNGAVWNLMGNDTYDIATDEAATVLIPMRIDFNYTAITSAPEWLTGEMTEDGFRVSIAENNTGARRTATLTFSSTLGERTYTFHQFGLKVIAGQYTATFGPDEDLSTPAVTRDVELRLIDAEKLYFGIYGLCDDENICTVMTYDPATHNLTLIPGQQYPGGTTTYNGTTAYGYSAMVGFNYEKMMATYTPFLQDYPCTMDEERGKPTFAFTDNGSWNGLVQNGFRIDLMPDEYPSDSKKLVTLIHVIDLHLVKK